MEISDFERVLGGNLLKQDGSVPTETALRGVGLVLLYFAAHWAFPCRSFTTDLLHFYTSVNTPNAQIEVIYISCDQDQPTFESFYASMPWLGVDYQEKGRRERLCKDFNATCLPKLVLIGRDAGFRCDSCRADIETLEVEAVLEKWRSALLSASV